MAGHRIKTFAKKAISSAADRAGFLIVPKWRSDARIEHADLLAQIFQTLKIDCVLDVGANRGQFKTFIRNQVGYGGTILSFEPVKQLADACRKLAQQDPDWHIFETALGDRDGRATMNVTERDTFSSFLNPLESELVKRRFAKFMTISAKVEVEIRSVDAVLPELMNRYKFARPFLKMDTQGFDLAVMNGASDSLKLIPALQTELSILPIYQNMPTWTAMVGNLNERGFALSGMFPITRDENLRVVEIDGIFVRQPSDS